MKYPFPEHKPRRALLVAATILGSLCVGLYFASLILKLTLPGLFGIPDPMKFMESMSYQLLHPQAALYTQVIASSLCLFLVPSIMFLMIYRANMVQRLRLTLPSVKYWIIAIVVMAAGGIFIQVLVQLMQSVPLPPVLGFLRKTGKEVAVLQDSFFAPQYPGYFFILAFAMALMPALGEEFFFRGTLQNTLRDFGITPVNAILITGFTFAVMHGEFDYVLGIWCMGVVLGLLYYYTDSLWVCILAHFLNNFTIVAVKYFHTSGVIEKDLISTDALPVYYTLPAGLVMVGGLVLLSRWSGRSLTAASDLTIFETTKPLT